MDLYCCLWDAWIHQLKVFMTAQAHLAWSWSPIYLRISINIYIHVNICYIQLPFILFQYGKDEKKGFLKSRSCLKFHQSNTRNNFTNQQFMLSVPGCVSKYSWQKPPKANSPGLPFKRGLSLNLLQELDFRTINSSTYQPSPYGQPHLDVPGS